MHFLNGLLKVAVLNNHSDGSEFQDNSGGPTPYGVGAPSMSTLAENLESGPDGPQKKKMSKKTEAVLLAIGKLASGDSGAVDGVGTQSDIADTTVSQLKWDTTTPADVVNNPKTSRFRLRRKK